MMPPPLPPPPGDGAIAYARSTMKIRPPSPRECRPSRAGILPHNAPETETGTRQSRRARSPRASPHEAQVEGEVVQGQEPVAEELARHEEVAQVGAREAAARLAGALGVERRAVARGSGRCSMLSGPSGVKACPLRRVARRQHAVEEIDAAGHRLHQVVGLAHAHEVARAVGRQAPRPPAPRCRTAPAWARPPRARRWRSPAGRARTSPPPRAAAARARCRPARCRRARLARPRPGAPRRPGASHRSVSASERSVSPRGWPDARGTRRADGARRRPAPAGSPRPTPA